MNRRNLLKSLFAVPLAALGMNKTLAALAAPAQDVLKRAPRTATGTAELNRITESFYNQRLDNLAMGIQPMYVRRKCVNEKCGRIDLHEAPVMCNAGIINMWID